MKKAWDEYRDFVKEKLPHKPELLGLLDTHSYEGLKKFIRIIRELKDQSYIHPSAVIKMADEGKLDDLVLLAKHQYAVHEVYNKLNSFLLQVNFNTQG